MTINDAMLLFGVTFLNVFFLGLQSRNVAGGRYMAAIVTSFFISIANFTFIRFAATGSVHAFAISAAGGCLGIACAIWFYQNVMKVEKRAATVTNAIQTMSIKVEVDSAQAIEELNAISLLAERVDERLRELRLDRAREEARHA